MRRNSEQVAKEVQHEDINSSLHKKRIVDDFMRLVEESDGRIRRVDEFARQLNVTPKYLSTILKEVMNRRPSTYILLYTLKAIERRLRFTDMTMQEIANDLNFPNPSFFGKYCKEHLGMTPLEYRMKYHK
jgi:AraC-like DNA-binding protein